VVQFGTAYFLRIGFPSLLSFFRSSISSLSSSHSAATSSACLPLPLGHGNQGSTTHGTRAALND